MEKNLICPICRTYIGSGNTSVNNQGGKISYHIAKRIVDIKYISLVNLIMDREVVKELIQDELNESTIFNELKKVLSPDHRKKLLSDYSELRTKLGGSGASEKAAKIVIANM